MKYKFSKKIPRHKLYVTLPALFKTLFSILFLPNKKNTAVLEIQKDLATIFKMEHCIVTSSCRISFYLVLKSLNLEKGAEVLLPPITVPDMVNAIQLLDLKPVFIDLDLNTHFIDLQNFKEKISPKSKVVLFTYLSGLVPEVSHFIDLAKKNSLFIIEDISQNYLSTYQNKNIGSFGNCAIGSFVRGKTLTSIGGGVILSNDEKLISKVQEIEHTICKHPSHLYLLKLWLGQFIALIASSDLVFSLLTFYALEIINIVKADKKFPTNEKAPYYKNPRVLRKYMPIDAKIFFVSSQVNLLKFTLNKLEETNQKRIKLVNYFLSTLDKKHLKKIPVSLVGQEHIQNVYWHLPFMTDDKEKFINYLYKKGIDSIGFLLANCAYERIFSKYYSACPNSKKITDNCVLLPIHSDFSKNDMLKIAKSINEYNLLKNK